MAPSLTVGLATDAAPAGRERGRPGTQAGDWIRGIAQAGPAAPPKTGRRECNRGRSPGPRRSA
jgi:hypothetical protein